MRVILGLYYYGACLASPLVKLWVQNRILQDKEHKERFYERYGISSVKRPNGKLLWFHGASVGEFFSVIPLFERLQASFPDVHILITTTTLTSAQIAPQRLPKGYIHQFIPFDIPFWVNRFIKTWQPDGVVFLESELWPNTIKQIKKRGLPLFLLNARLSKKSFQRWKHFPVLSKEILESFDLILAPSQDIADKFWYLGAKKVDIIPNLKFAAQPLPYKEEELKKCRQQILNRPTWIAASTHPGEEEIVEKIHQALVRHIPNLLTILISRHPHRGANIHQFLLSKGLNVSRRTLGQDMTNETSFYLVDTLGEVGLFYALKVPVFIGGTFVPIGGHNIIEPGQFGCPILCGPYMDLDSYKTLEPFILQVNTQEECLKQLKSLIQAPTSQNALQAFIQKNKKDCLETILNKISSYMGFY